MEDEDVLSVLGKGHQVSLPVARLATFIDDTGAFVQAFAMFDEFDASNTAAPEPSAAMFALWQEAIEPIFLVNLVIDVAID